MYDMYGRTNDTQRQNTTTKQSTQNIVQHLSSNLHTASANDSQGAPLSWNSAPYDLRSLPLSDCQKIGEVVRPKVGAKQRRCGRTISSVGTEPQKQWTWQRSLQLCPAHALQASRGIQRLHLFRFIHRGQRLCELHGVSSLLSCFDVYNFQQILGLKNQARRPRRS